jgi:hypothetical protein
MHGPSSGVSQAQPARGDLKGNRKPDSVGTMTLTRFVDGIAKTGFPFEHYVAELFRGRDWNVRHGTHYVDDVTEDVREIDIVAEKSSDVEGLRIHTVCIVSCKKSDLNAWVMLAHERATDDWLRDRRLKQLTTNDEVLQHVTASSMWPWDDPSVAVALDDAKVSILAEPEQTIFAFQEMNKSTGAPQNDKAIFATITSLLKAQAHEIAAHAREKQIAAYQYNLLSAVDADLVRLDFPENASSPSATSVDRQTYLADYIVNQEPISAPIRFVTRLALAAELEELDALHSMNVRHFPALREAFYPDCLSDWRKRKVFEGRIVADLRTPIATTLKRDPIPETDLGLGWDSDGNSAVLELGDGTEREVAALNENDRLRDRLKELLKTQYRYEGDSRFALRDWFAELKAMAREYGRGRSI